MNKEHLLCNTEIQTFCLLMSGFCRNFLPWERKHTAYMYISHISDCIEIIIINSFCVIIINSFCPTSWKDITGAMIMERLLKSSNKQLMHVPFSVGIGDK